MEIINLLAFERRYFWGMEIMFIMLIVSLFIALFFLGLFIWANKTGQYDDDVTPGMRILFEDQKKEIIHKKNKSKTKNKK